jgi:hypothetical protein
MECVLPPLSFPQTLYSSFCDRRLLSSCSSVSSLRWYNAETDERCTVYLCYIGFQLGSHAAMFKDDSTDVIKSIGYKPKPGKPKTPTPSDVEMLRSPRLLEHGSLIVQEPESAVELQTPSTVHGGDKTEAEQDNENESPQMNGWVCIILLVTVTVVRPFPSFHSPFPSRTHEWHH